MAKTMWRKGKKKEDGEGTSKARTTTPSPKPAPTVEETGDEEGSSKNRTEEAVEEERGPVVVEISDEECGSGNQTDEAGEGDLGSGNQTEEAGEEDLGSGNGEEKEEDSHSSKAEAEEGQSVEMKNITLSIDILLDETEPMGPERMWFSKTDYGKTIKISTRCYIWKAVENLKKLVDPDELEWFEQHEQFCHFFHMPKAKNHMSMGVWLLILRKAQTGKKNEAWFVVNGVPIRYSLREHGLMSGLYCHSYPPKYQEFGNLEVVSKHFEEVKPTYEKVEKKFLSMKRCDGNDDRLKIAVLYFLSSIIIGQAKTGVGAPVVEDVFRRAVSDLEWCKSFPWGRLSFDHSLERIVYMVQQFEGVPNPLWCLPNFIIPLELLAFEAIPELKKRFRQEVKSPWTMCPRMCKSKFKPTYMRGFALSELNDALGTTKDIQSILKATPDEVALLWNIMDDHLDDDHCDPVVDGWMKILVKQKKLWFEELYNADMDGRKEENQSVVVSLGKRKRNGKGKEKEKEKEKKKEKEKEKKDECGESLRKIIEAGLKQIGDQMITLKTEVTEKLADLEKKMEYVFNYVPPMDVNSSKEKVVGEPSSAKEKAVAKEKEAQEVVKEKEVAKEKEVEEVPKEKDVEEVVKEKEVAKEMKKKRKSYSELVQGHFKRPKTRSNNHS